MVNLSLWQFDRLDQRQEFNAVVEQRSSEEVIDVSTADLSAPEELEWRRMGAAGTYRSDADVLILNRSQGGRAGLNVVTPMELDNGSVVLVVRGFLPLDGEVPPAPEGRVRVIGTARVSEVPRAADANEFDEPVRELFRLDIARIDEQVDGDIVPVALYARVSDPADAPTLVPVADPTLTEGSHLSYAIQWLIFATAVVVGWVLAMRRTLQTSSRSRPSA